MVTGFGFRFNREENKKPERTPEQQQKFLANVDKSYSTNIVSHPAHVPLEDKLTMVARDPNCLFAYPAFDSRTKDKIRTIYGEKTMGSWRIEEVSSKDPSFSRLVKKYDFELRLNDAHPNWYFTEGIESGKEYQSKFEIKGIDTLVSNIAKTAVNYVSLDTSCTWGSFNKQGLFYQVQQ